MKNANAHILIAEQDLLWARTIAQGLRAQGHQITTATNGCEVLALLLRHHFDAMLIDLDLPTINGLDVTNSLRRSEQGTDTRMAVIGLAQLWTEVDSTVLTGCGFDDTLRKGFSMDALLAVLSPRLPMEPMAPVSVASAAALPPLTQDCVDADKVTEFIASDSELYAEMVSLLIQEYPRRLAQIGAAIEQRDGKTLERGAHSLKGSLSYFCSKQMIERLQRLENFGRKMEFSEAAGLQAELDAVFPALKKALQARLAVGAPSSSPAHAGAA